LTQLAELSTEFLNNDKHVVLSVLTGCPIYVQLEKYECLRSSGLIGTKHSITVLRLPLFSLALKLFLKEMKTREKCSVKTKGNRGR
jgi:uncharacterized protein (DUF779 family)